MSLLDRFRRNKNNVIQADGIKLADNETWVARRWGTYEDSTRAAHLWRDAERSHGPCVEMVRMLRDELARLERERR
jgi:hypothetical protein